MAHERHVFYDVLGGENRPQNALWWPKGTYFTGSPNRSSTSETNCENHYILYWKYDLCKSKKKCSASRSLRKNDQCIGENRPSGRFAPFAQATHGLETKVKTMILSKVERGLEKLVKYQSFKHQNAIIRGPDTTKRGWRRQAGQKCDFRWNIHWFLQVDHAKGEQKATSEPE